MIILFEKRKCFQARSIDFIKLESPKKRDHKDNQKVCLEAAILKRVRNSPLVK